MISNAVSNSLTSAASIDQSLKVWVNWAGEPVKFSWQGLTYAVVAKPTRWFDRRQWWAEAGRVQRGVGAQVLEVEMWRVVAERQTNPEQSADPSASKPSAPTQFELMHTKSGWQLISVQERA